MQFCVYHAEKGKGSGSGIGNHIDRTIGMEHSYPHADPERRSKNIQFEVYAGREKLKLSEAIESRIKEGYRSRRKIRKDAVRYISHVLSGSHEQMQAIFSDPEKALRWCMTNEAFLASEFGEKNIVRLTLHLDEKTPHMHAITVPVTQKGGLSAKEVFGNKQKLEKRQDRYAAMMSRFGLERGIRGTGIKHEEAKSYYKRISEGMKHSESQSEIKPVKGFFKTNWHKTTLKQKKALKTALESLSEANEHRKRDRIRLNTLQRKNERLDKTLKEIKTKALKINKINMDLHSDMRKLLQNQGLYAKTREEYLAKQQKHQQRQKNGKEQDEKGFEM